MCFAARADVNARKALPSTTPHQKVLHLAFTQLIIAADDAFYDCKMPN